MIAGISQAFSLCHNFQILIDTEKKFDEVSCLHGLRLLNSLALLLSHKQMALLFIPYTNRTFTAQVCMNFVINFFRIKLIRYLK